MNTDKITIGISLSLTGSLASNGKTALLAHKIWETDVNNSGGLLGRAVEVICLDDQTNAELVINNYKSLVYDKKVDVVAGGYGTNSIAPALPFIMQEQKYFVGVMGLGANSQHHYANYFAMIPTGPTPNSALTEGFFELAARQNPKPQSVAIVVADALFSRNPVIGAKENAKKFGMNIVYENNYSLSTTDFSSVMEELKKVNADVLFLCSYLNDSIALVRAIDKHQLLPKIVGGAMIGPQNGAVKAELGPLLNGFVNYEYWLPNPLMDFPGVKEMITKYQSKAAEYQADPLGHYVAPQAYAQMQVIAQAINNTASLDNKVLSDYTRDTVFDTVVGKVKFGKDGEWEKSRVLQIQFQNITGHSVEQFKDSKTQKIVSPSEFAGNEFIYPYAVAKNRK